MSEGWLSQPNDETFSCRNCGNDFTVYPPGEQYKMGMLVKCSHGCEKFTKHICKDCRMRVTVYWCRYRETGIIH